MDLSSSFFDEIEEDFSFSNSPPPKRPRTPTSIRGKRSRRPLPVINENGGHSPKCGVSCLCDDFNNTNENISPPFSPVKMHLSPQGMHSPPSIQRGVLALKLFDTPHTPKTLFNKFKRAAGDSGRLHKDRDKAVPQTRSRNRMKLKDEFNLVKSCNLLSGTETFNTPTVERPVILANINPYTPSPYLQSPVLKHKRNRNEFEK